MLQKRNWWKVERQWGSLSDIGYRCTSYWWVNPTPPHPLKILYCNCIVYMIIQWYTLKKIIKWIWIIAIKWVLLENVTQKYAREQIDVESSPHPSSFWREKSQWMQMGKISFQFHHESVLDDFFSYSTNPTEHCWAIPAKRSLSIHWAMSDECSRSVHSVHTHNKGTCPRNVRWTLCRHWPVNAHPCSVSDVHVFSPRIWVPRRVDSHQGIPADTIIDCISMDRWDLWRPLWLIQMDWKRHIGGWINVWIWLGHSRF